jgi:hypothetical protein
LLRSTRVFALIGCSTLVACGSSDHAGRKTQGTVDAGRTDAGHGDAGAADAGAPLRLGALHAEPDAINGGAIVDDEGRTVLLRGTNVNALAEYWQYGSFPTTFPFTDADVDRVDAIGWNAIRLLLSWSRVEPNPGEYDDAYLATVDDVIARLSRHGIYTIVDLHQDAWGATLAARPDEVCPSGQPLAVGWDGAPGWATQDGGAARCAAISREFSPAVRTAWGAFWTDAAGPGGVGIRTRYTQMLGALAHRYAKEPAVAGFDVMNEPNAFGPAEGDSLSSLYAEALAAIRAGEKDAGGFDHLMLFEPSALWSTTGSGAPPDFARDANVVYAPHVYQGGFTSGAISRAAFDTAISEAATFGGAPVLSGEWGTGPERALPTGDGYFLTHQAFQDDTRVSATLWTFHESCGDPHKAGDALAGNVPSVWGEFEVDCTTNTITGPRTALVGQLTRAYVRAAPGLSSTHYDPASGAFAASGNAAQPSIPLIAFYPAAQHGSPSPTSSGLDGVRVVQAPGGNVYVAGESRGGPWSISVAGEADGAPGNVQSLLHGD